MKFLKKFFSKKVVVEPLSYLHPLIPCSSLILLSGPAYGDKTFLGSFLLDVGASSNWISDHSKSVYSSFKLVQEARLCLPKWIFNSTPLSDSYITEIDNYMRQVLVPYTYDFYLKGWLKVYCHECSMLHDTLIDNSTNSEKDGNVRRWVEEWQCPKGHIVHRKDEEIRIITR